MEEASKIALVAGFGGVILGGLITFATEWIFRKQDQKAAAKKNFVLCLVETGRIYSELGGLYRSLTDQLGEDAPVLISSNIRGMASSTIRPSTLETEKLFAANHKKDELFSDLDLLIRRFNSNIDTFQAINESKNRITARQLKVGQLSPLGEQDVVEIAFGPTDAQSIAEMVSIENLYRGFFKNIIADVETCAAILQRLNVNSERKFKPFPW